MWKIPFGKGTPRMNNTENQANEYKRKTEVQIYCLDLVEKKRKEKEASYATNEAQLRMCAYK